MASLLVSPYSGSSFAQLNGATLRNPQITVSLLLSLVGPTGRLCAFREATAPVIDTDNPVVRLCAEGVALEGTPAEAKRRFEAAWAARTDDYEAAIAAHFLARHQGTAQATLHWNTLALQHAVAVTDGRTAPFMASLYLNLADAHASLGEREAAGSALAQADVHLAALPPDGYRTFIGMGIRRLAQELGMVDRLLVGDSQ